MEDAEKPARAARSNLRRNVRALVIFVLFLAGAYWGIQLNWRYQHPYGWSHACDKMLSGGLRQYAEDHQGAFPTGGATPEASLCLLYSKYADAAVLVGKITPKEVAEKMLSSGQPLTPETCSWQYVEGLHRVSNGAKVALLWDKAGLGHNGERLSTSARYVLMMDGGAILVADDVWPQFLKEQEKGWAEIRAGKEPTGPWPVLERITAWP